MTSKRPGRPALPKNLKRVNITLTVTRETREKLWAAADYRKTTVSKIIEHLVETKPMIFKEPSK